MKKSTLFAALLCLIPVVCFAAFAWNSAAITAWNAAAITAWDGVTTGIGSLISQTITWNTQPAALTYPATESLTNATASSSLPITYSTDTPTYCSVSGSVGSQVLNSVNATGNCVVHADQAGNGTYSAATRVDSGNVAITAPVYTDCSQIGSHAFAWFGDYTGHTEYGCKGTSTTVTGVPSVWTVVVSGTDPGTASPTSGGNCLKATATSGYLKWPITSKDIFDSAKGAMQVDIWATGLGTNNYFMGATYSGQNNISARLMSDGTVKIYYLGNNVTATVQSTDTVPNTGSAAWTTVYIKWSVSQNILSVKIGSGAWKNQSGQTVTAWTNEPGYVSLGTGESQTFYLDNFYVTTSEP